MGNNGITSIAFLPVCIKCRNIIWQTINCEKRTAIVCGIPRCIGDKYDIEPEKCPNCGRFINRIVIPTNLPFNGEQYIELESR